MPGYKKGEMNVVVSVRVESSEYSEEFDRIRRNQVAVSFHKYGPAKKNFKEGRVDAIASCKKKMARYRETGNKEFLADAANYLMFEFMYPLHPEAHYQPTDDDRKSRPVGTPINMEKE